MENKYIKSYYRFLVNSVATGMEYRGSFIFKNISGLVWMLSAFLFINVLFSQSNSTAGWNKNQMVILYLTFSIAADIFTIFLKDNLQKFLDLIHKGQLDIYLTKPINTQFLISLMSGQVSYATLFRLTLAILFLIRYAPHASLLSWLIYFTLIAIGTITVYSIIFMIHVLNIWLIRLDNITELTGQSYELAKVPVESWPRQIRFFLTYLFPLGLLSSVAVKSLYSSVNWWTLIISLAIAPISLFFSTRFFTFALRHYSSASS